MPTQITVAGLISESNGRTTDLLKFRTTLEALPTNHQGALSLLLTTWQSLMAPGGMTFEDSVRVTYKILGNPLEVQLWVAGRIFKEKNPDLKRAKESISALMEHLVPGE